MGTTRIGVPAKLLAGFAYLAAFFSGYVAFFLIGGYILLREQNDWLRFHAIKAGVLMACFSVLSALIAVIPSLFSWIGSIVALFGGYFHPDFIYDAQNLLSNTLTVLERVAFLVLAFFAFRGGDLPLGPLDKLTNTMLGLVPAAPAAPVAQPMQQPMQQPVPQPMQQPMQQNQNPNNQY